MTEYLLPPLMFKRSPEAEAYDKSLPDDIPQHKRRPSIHHSIRMDQEKYGLDTILKSNEDEIIIKTDFYLMMEPGTHVIHRAIKKETQLYALQTAYYLDDKETYVYEQQYRVKANNETWELQAELWIK